MWHRFSLSSHVLLPMLSWFEDGCKETQGQVSNFSISLRKTKKTETTQGPYMKPIIPFEETRQKKPNLSETTWPHSLPIVWRSLGFLSFFGFLRMEC